MVRVSQTSQNKASRERVLADLQEDPETSFDSDLTSITQVMSIKLSRSNRSISALQTPQFLDSEFDLFSNP